MGRQPQQPELRRHEQGATVQDSAKAKADNRNFDRDKHPTPPGNQPGWMQAEQRPAKTEQAGDRAGIDRAEHGPAETGQQSGK